MRLPGLLLAACILATAAEGAAAERVRVRVGEHAGFSRVVFDWARPVGVRLERRAAGVVLHFDRVAELDLRRFRGDPPPGVGDIAVLPAAPGLAVAVATPPGAETRLFESEGKTVFDVLKPAKPSTGPTPPAVAPGTPLALHTAAGAAEAGPASSESDARSAPLPASDVAAPVPLLPPSHGRAPPQPPAAAVTPAPEPAAASVPAAPPPAAPAPDPAPDAEQTPERAVVPPPAVKPAAPARAAAETGAPAAPDAPADVAAPRTAPAPKRDSAPVVSVAGPFIVDPSPQPGRTLTGALPRTLRLAWPAGTGAAAFHRNGRLWLLFDRPPPSDLAQRIAALAPELAPVEQLAPAGATVLRLPAPPGLTARLARDETDWIVELEPGSRVPAAGLEPELAGDGANPVLRYPVSDPGRLVEFTDPDTGDRLMVVTLTHPGPAARDTHEFPQFRVLESRLGLILQPLSDGLRVVVRPQAIDVDDDSGLIVSHGASLARLESNEVTPPLGQRLFDLPAWRRGGAARFQALKQELQGALVAAGPDELDGTRLALAQFYFAHGLITEALGILRLSESKAPRMSRDPRVRLMLGAGAFLNGDLGSAAEALSDPALAGEVEADLWRAAVAAANQHWDFAAQEFAKCHELIAAYPHGVGARLRLLAAEAALATGDLDMAEEQLAAVRDGDPSHAEEAQLAYLTARKLFLAGDRPAAAELWERVAASRHRLSRVRGRLALLDLGLEDGSIGVEQAIEDLERLRFAWRGDRFEVGLLERLGDLYLRQKDYRAGLRLLRRAAAQAPSAQTSEAIAGRMRDIFVRLLTAPPDAGLPALQALALFEEFKELTPAGRDGDAVILALADRMVAVDLLDRAAEELERQIAYRLEGPAKARAAARLADIRLSDEQPDKALVALESTEMAGLPEALVDERQRLKARALLALDRGEAALAALGGADDPEARRLRARILWHRKNWPAAVVALERLVPDAPPAERAMTEREARDVIDLAVALTMAGERAKTLQLGRAYANAMSEGPWRDTFALLAGDLDLDRAKSVAEELAQVETVEAFLASYRERTGARPPDQPR